jgi:hypothetical protein
MELDAGGSAALADTALPESATPEQFARWIPPPFAGCVE